MSFWHTVGHAMYSLWTVDLLVSSFVVHSSSLTVKSVDLVIAFFCIVHSGYFQYRGAYQTVPELCYCVMDKT